MKSYIHLGPILIKRNFLKKGMLACLAILLAMQCNSDNSTWIWKIEGKKLTINQLNAAHDAYIVIAAQQMQTTADRLKEIMKDPSKAPNEQVYQMVQQELRKDNFAERYKQLILLNNEARKSGFLQKEGLQSQIEFMKQFFVANLYIAERLKPDDVKISEEEAIEGCENIRKRDRRLKAVPIEQCMEYAKQQIQLGALRKKQEEMMKSITEGYKIVSNPDFDLKEYVKSEAAPGSQEQKGDKSPASTEKKDSK